MARSIRVRLAACSLLLGTAPAVATSVSQDLAAPLEADNECTVESSCALELAQLRSRKVQAGELGAAGPSHTHAKAHTARTASKARSKTKGSASAQAQHKAHSAGASLHKAHAASASEAAVHAKATSQAKAASSEKGDIQAQAKSHAKIKAAHKTSTKSGGKRAKASSAKEKTSRSEAGAVRASSKSSKDIPDYGHPAWLSSCKRIFLDVGANIGVSIRKLFEAQKYTGSKLLPFFDEHFGELQMRQEAGEQSGLCALGLEPNPEHRERLQALEEAYGNNGWRVHFYPFAAWDTEGEMPLNTTGARVMSEADVFHRGAHLSMHLAEGQPVLASSLVRTVNLATFVDSLPQSSVSLALMDIEGAEYETLAQLMMEKKLCQSSILNLLVEAHDWGDVSKWGGPTSFSQGVHPRSTMAIGERLSQMAEMGWCPEGDNVTYVAKLDDPSYATDVDENFGQH